jgi:hypothetical protein
MEEVKEHPFVSGTLQEVRGGIAKLHSTTMEKILLTLYGQKSKMYVGEEEAMNELFVKAILNAGVAQMIGNMDLERLPTVAQLLDVPFGFSNSNLRELKGYFYDHSHMNHFDLNLQIKS